MTKHTALPPCKTLCHARSHGQLVQQVLLLALIFGQCTTETEQKNGAKMACLFNIIEFSRYPLRGRRALSISRTEP